MTRYVAFLRAVNVAGHATVKMTDLNQAFVSAGCERVRTVIQSGNVLFEAASRDLSKIIQKVRLGLRELLKSDVTVLFRTMSEVERLLSSAPFKKFESEAGAKLYVAFLAEKPRRRPVLPLVSAKEALEAFKVQDREAFIVSRRKSNGMYGFPNNFIEKELGVPATTRNWSTVRKIAGLARSPGESTTESQSAKAKGV